MIYQAFVFLLSLSIVFSAKCPIFVCNTTSGNTYTADPVKCSTKSVAATGQATFKLTNCGSAAQYCNFSYSNATSYCSDITAQIGYLYPGEFCSDSAQCTTKNCKSNICTGADIGGVCAKDLDCNPGLYCNNVTLKCNTTAALGEKCASNSPRCANHLTCIFGKCILLGSLDLDAPSDGPLGCKSYFIAADQYGVMKCATAPSLDTDATTPCTLGTICNYTQGTRKFATPCKCGTNTVGNGFCHPGLGKLSSDISLVRIFPLNINSSSNMHK
jgi:hypothetical protein